MIEHFGLIIIIIKEDNFMVASLPKTLEISYQIEMPTGDNTSVPACFLWNKIAVLTVSTCNSCIIIRFK